MKELDTYKAEIFQRSEVRIKQRKKRRRIALGAGLPLCLCVVATAAMMSFSLGATKMMDAAPEMAPDCAAPAEQVLVQDQGQKLSVTDPATVAALRLLLDGYQEESSDLENGSAESNQTASDALKDQLPAESRIITLVWEGQQEQYRLTGRQLYQEATGYSRILTAEELDQLEALLQEAADDE